MKTDIDIFLANYNDEVQAHALQLRNLLLASFSGIIEQLDLPAKMIAYTYGQKYVDLICVLIPSKKGLKLGFNRGVELPDPDKLLEGTGKISRYIQIRSEEQINSKGIQTMLSNALKLFNERMELKSR